MDDLNRIFTYTNLLVHFSLSLHYSSMVVNLLFIFDFFYKRVNLFNYLNMDEEVIISW